MNKIITAPTCMKCGSHDVMYVQHAMQDATSFWCRMCEFFSMLQADME